MKRGEVYYAELNNLFGSVQHGERPCVILQNDIGNTHSATTIVAPMTTRRKKDMPTHVETSELDENLAAGTTVLLEQVCTIDKQKIKRFVCALSKETMNNVDTALKISLSLKEKERCEKMKDTIKINDREIHVKEYMRQRVVTFKDIDDVHERPDGTAKRIFETNKQRFIEGEDFFLISKSEDGADFVQTYGFGESAPSGILITENGYLMIAKSITGDLSLEVQGNLVKSYFNRKSQMPAEEMMREKLSIIDEHERRIKELEDCITIDYKNQRALEAEVKKP